MSNLNHLDVTDFKMTRLSDVIDPEALEGGLRNIEISELDESNLEELERLIEQIELTCGVQNKAQVNIQQECTEEFLKETKYTRDELLMLGSSPASKLSPPGWDEVVNQLPSAITNVQKESPIVVNKYIYGDKLGKTAITNAKGISTSNSQLLHRAINQEVQIHCDSKEQLRKELNPGQEKGHTLFQAFPSDSLSKASTITNDSLSKASTITNDFAGLTHTETEQSGNKNTFIDNLIHEKLVNRPLDQPDLEVNESTSSTRNEKTTSPSEASIPCSKPSLPGSKPSLPSSKPSLPGSKPSLPSSKPSLLGSKNSLPDSKSSLPSSNNSFSSSKPSLTSVTVYVSPSSKSSLPFSKCSLPCSKSSLPSSGSSLPCSKSSLPSSNSSLPCSKSSLPCSKPSLPCSKPSLPCSKPSLPCSKPSLPCSKSSLPSSKSSLPSSKSSLPCSKSSLPCSKSSLPCNKSSLPCNKSSLPSSGSSLPCSKSSLPCSKSSFPCSRSSLPCSKSSLLCSICDELCKRGVLTPCCNAKACRYCAVKTITDLVSNVDRKCWNCGKSPVATLDLIVDHDLREAVQSFNVEEL